MKTSKSLREGTMKSNIKNIQGRKQASPPPPTKLIEQFSSLRDENIELLKTLAEIAKGEGRYDMDKLKHAGNTIEDMKKLAEQAIKATE